MPETLIGSTTASRILGVSVSTLKRWVDEGAIPAYRTLGGHRRIRQGDLVRFATKNGIPVRSPKS